MRSLGVVGVEGAPKLMLKLSSVFLLALLMDDSLPILESAIGIPPSLLYRNSKGEKVVCDLQGDWKLQLLGAVPTDLNRLGSGFTCLSTETESDVWGWAATRIELESHHEMDETGKNFEGQGWVAAADCTIELNNDASPIKIPESFGPVILPFWNGFRADKMLSFRRLEIRLEEIASFSPQDTESAQAVDFKVERASQAEVLSARNGRGESTAAPVFSHLNRAGWSVQIPEHAQIIIIQRLFDAFHGLQRARVFLDSDMAGWWHSPFQDRINRWKIDSFHSRLKEDQKGRRLRVTIDPPAGVPLFSLGEIRIFVLSS